MKTNELRIDVERLSQCPRCGYYAFNGYECFDCGYIRG